MVQFHAKLSPLTPHHRHTLMLQNQQRWLKNKDQKIGYYIILLHQWESVRQWPMSSYGQISVCGDAGGARSLSAPHWAECADDGRISTNLLPAQPSPAQPSPARHRYEGWEDTIFSVEVLCSMLWGTRFCAESLIIYEKSRGDRLGVFVQISKK